MPIYNYQCTECGEQIEKLVKHSDPAPDCTDAAHGAMQKQLTVPAFKFKNGQGTDAGSCMAIPGYSLPQG